MKREIQIDPPIINGAPELTVIRGKNRSPRRFWRPLLILMLLVEWAVDLVREIVTVAHNSIKVLTLTLKSYLDEPTGPKPSA